LNQHHFLKINKPLPLRQVNRLGVGAFIHKIMSKIAMLAFLGLLSTQLFAQYTRFNEIQYSTANLGSLPYGSYEMNNEYFTYHIDSPTVFCLPNSLNGEPSPFTQSNTNVSFQGATGVGGDIMKTYNNVFFPITLMNNCGYYYMGIIKFDGDQFINAYTYEFLNGDCDEHKEHIPATIFSINDSTIATVSYRVSH
jgi:hypothetical protein